jgi:ABC-type transport system involved in multi-copper enzyme maturation permease subunit
MGSFIQAWWKLLPGNPLMARVVASSSTRTRDLLIRCAYLGMLVLLVLPAIIPALGVGSNALAELNEASRRIFEQLSFVQLALVALVAPIFAAGAIAQQRDAQTYDVLLATPLSNAQIVLGTLTSRLFFIYALLLSGVPVFSITQIFGGVSISSIVLSVLIAAVTAWITGAVAVAVSTFFAGSRRTIFGFYLVNATYLVGLFLLDRLDVVRVPMLDAAGGGIIPAATSWLTGLHPFLALRVVLDPLNYAPPGLADLPAGIRFWPLSWLATSPVSFFLWTQVLLGLVLVAPSTLLLRRVASNPPDFKRLWAWALPRSVVTRRPKTVWHNPIAWREAKTRAGGNRANLTRVGFVLVGLAGAITVLALNATERELPAQFVDVGSLGSGGQTLFVQGDRPATYRLDPGVQVKLEGQDGVLALLGTRQAVTFMDVTIVDGSPVIRSIDLAPIPTVLDRATATRLLLGLVLVEIVAILLVVTNAAATTVTREREDGSLDLMLSTPITSRFYLGGKVRGLVTFALPLAAVPMVTCAVAVMFDLVRLVRFGSAGFEWLVLPESILLVPLGVVVLCAFASISGMFMSLRFRTSVAAMMASIALVLGVAGGLGWCGFALADQGGWGSGLFAALSPLTLVGLVVAPTDFQGLAGDPLAYRLAVLVAGLAAPASYSVALGWFYRTMVKNFDMTVRRQSR